MGGELIELTDGTRLEIKINFGTMYYLQKCGGGKLANKIQRILDKNEKIADERKKIKISDNDQMDFAAYVIYSVLRSNGRKVTFDEALELCYPDTDSLQAVIDAYSKEMERVKKKEQLKQEQKDFQKGKMGK